MCRRSLIAVVALAMIFTSMLPAADAKTDSTKTPRVQISRALEAFHKARGPNAQVEAAEHIRDVVLAVNPDAVNAETIHAVASILENKNDAVEYWIAEAVGHFGHRARFAAPQLLKILRARQCVIAETSSVQMIQRTLRLIGAPAQPEKCKYLKFPN